MNDAKLIGTAGKNTVETPIPAYAVMVKHWELIDDLLGGTLAMRKAETKWLPKEPAEKDSQYQSRINRSILFNGYKDTVVKLVAKPFSKSITVRGTLPDQLSRVVEDVDRTQCSLTQLGRQSFASGINRGLVHFLVDYPKMPEGATKADEQAVDARATITMIDASRIVGWRSVIEPNGNEKLTQVRIKETRVKDDGEYGVKEIQAVRVFTEDSWEIWEKPDDQSDYQKTEFGTHTFGQVPLITCYIERTGFMTGEPPLENLAWVNLAH